MNKSRILVVEDSTTVAEDCKDCLESLGYEVTSIVASGEESIKRAESEKPDAVLMDIKLRDDMDGIEAAEQIYSRYEIPVVFLSAYDDHEILQRAKLVGSFGYLVKPYEERELFATLEMAMYKSKAEHNRRIMEKRMFKLQKKESLSILASGIGHDFNNILTAILGNASITKKILSPDSPALPTVDEIIVATKRAAELTKQMLAYSGKGKFILQDFDLSDLVRKMAQLIKSSISKKAVLSLQLDPDLPAINGDMTQVQQIVMNLLINASESLENEAGSISVICEVRECTSDNLLNAYFGQKAPAGDCVYLEVSDNGCGIDNEVLSKIFDPFFSTKFAGRGLGLAATMGIIESHDAAINVTSDGKTGTTFSIYFPISGPHLVSEKEKVPKKKRTSGTGTIMIVDDEPAILSLTKMILEGAGYTVLTAPDGLEAVNIYRTNLQKIDLVVLDLTMPRMDGREAFSAMMQLNPDVKVILSSGYGEEEAKQGFTGKDLKGFLPKPYLPTILLEKVAEVLEK